MQAIGNYNSFGIDGPAFFDVKGMSTRALDLFGLCDVMLTTANKIGCNRGGCKQIKVKGSSQTLCNRLTSCPKKAALQNWAIQFNTFYKAYAAWIRKLTGKSSISTLEILRTAALASPLAPMAVAWMAFDHYAQTSITQAFNAKSNAVALDSYAAQYEKLRVQLLQIIKQLKAQGKIVQNFPIPVRLYKGVTPTGPWDWAKKYGPWIAGGAVAIYLLPTIAMLALKR